MTVTAYASVILVVLVILFSVIFGVSKQLVSGQRISSDVSTIANAKTFDFPNTSSNFRDIVKLRAAVARLEAEDRAEEDRAAGGAAGDDQLGGGGRGRGDEQRTEGSTTSQGAVVQYYPEPAEETQNNSDHDAGLRGNQSDSHGGIGVAGRSEDTVVFAGGLRSRTNTRNDSTEVSSPALRASGGSHHPERSGIPRGPIIPDGDDDH